MDEYVIINKTKVLKIIEDLERELIRMISKNYSETSRLQIEFTLNTYKQILSQSTSLIPILENAFDSGRKLSNKSQLYTPDFYWTKENYISNLKLNI